MLTAGGVAGLDGFAGRLRPLFGGHIRSAGFPALFPPNFPSATAAGLFLRHYHQRSNAESVFSMMKAKFGDSVGSKREVGQVNEVLAKVLCHNMCVLIRAAHDLGVEPNFGAGSGVEPKIFVWVCFHRILAQCPRIPLTVRYLYVKCT